MRIINILSITPQILGWKHWQSYDITFYINCNIDFIDTKCLSTTYFYFHVLFIMCRETFLLFAIVKQVNFGLQVVPLVFGKRSYFRPILLRTILTVLVSAIYLSKISYTSRYILYNTKISSGGSRWCCGRLIAPT